MSESREAGRYQYRTAAIQVGVLIVAGFVIGYPTRWWSWVMAAVMAAVVARTVARTSRVWIDSLDQRFAAIDGATLPGTLEETRSKLSRLGFKYEAAFSSGGDDIGIAMLSPDGASAARAIAYGGATWSSLVTRWPDGQSLVTGNFGTSLAPDEHLQLLSTLELEQSAAVHSAAVGILSRSYGTPSPPDLTAAAINETIRHRLDRYRSRRYRQTARALLAHRSGLHGRPIAAQLGINQSAWLIWTMTAMLAAALVASWWWSISGDSPRGYIDGISATVVFGGLIAYAVIHMRRRQRFLP